MPKAAQHRVVWSAEHATYLLSYPDGKQAFSVTGEDWAAWQSACRSFAFNGQQGRLTLLKEVRNGETYWYAYRRQGTCTRKKYAGRVAGLSIERLEALAALLSRPAKSEADDIAPDVHFLPPILQSVSPPPPSPLLAAKLSAPRLHSDTIERVRLLTRLDTGLERKMTLVSAPAGFGKTTVVRQWIAQREVDAHFPAVAWLSLDAADNDPHRFWRYVIAACQIFGAGAGDATLAALRMLSRPPFEPESTEAILIPLLNDLAGLKTGAILVLDDFHNITAPYLQQMLGFFVDHLPPTLHLCILTRSDPLLPLTRLRAMNELCEVRAADLRFAPDETQTFLGYGSTTPLSAETLARLDEKLEGWAAGLRLLAVALHQRVPAQTIAHYIETFGGSQHAILEYFVSEVLNAQPAAVQDFLLHTSMLDRLTGPLCDAATGRTGSAQLLATLARANVFLEVSDDAAHWYRYHALFAEAMQHEAQHRFSQEALRAVWRRASRWYEEQAMLAEAVEATLRAQDPERAATVITRMVDQQRGLQHIDMHTLRRWLEILPAAVLNTQPALCMAYAVALLFVAQPGQPSPTMRTQIDHALDAAETGFRSAQNMPKLGEVFAFRALLARQRGDIPYADACAMQALDWLPPDEISWRSWSLATLGSTALYAGNLTTARALLLDARVLGEIDGNRVYLRANSGMLSGVYGESGDLRQAEANVRQVLTEARDEGDLDDVAHAQLGLAHVAYEWNDLGAAQLAAQESLDLGQHFGNDEIVVGASTMLARIEHAGGQTSAALQRCAGLLARLQPDMSPVLYRLNRDVLAIQARFYVQEGNLWSAQSWRENRRDDVTLACIQREREEILVARLLYMQGHTIEARAQLDTLLAEALAAGRRRNALEMQLVLAQIDAAEGHRQKATQTIISVLAFAHSQKYMRLFLDHGESLAKLLRQVDPASAAKELRAYLQTLLSAFDQERNDSIHASPDLVEQLSRQEVKVLRLLAAGRTNAEIASEQVVSINTVRTQVQSIYRKLAVNNRRDAASLARQTRLI